MEGDLKEQIWEVVKLGDETLLAGLLDRACPGDFDHEAKFYTNELKEERSFTALMLAAYTGKDSITESILRSGADANRQSAENGWTALMAASLGDQLEVVRSLLEWKADVNLQDKDGCTALMWAAPCGHLEVVWLLLGWKADVNLRNKDGWTALMRTAWVGNLEVGRFLLQLMADVNVQNKDGCTALMWAASKGHLEMVRLFMERNADVNLQHKDGWTALMWAAYQGHLEVVRLLLEWKADVNLRNKDGWTALMWAASMRRLEVVRLLLEWKADVNVQQSKYGVTALMWAAFQGHLEMVRLLLEWKANVDWQDKAGWTALMWAAFQGHLEVVRLLLQWKADVNQQNKDGRRAADFAKTADIQALIASQGGRRTRLIGGTNDALFVRKKEQQRLPPHFSTVMMTAEEHKQADAKLFEEILQRGSKPFMRSKLCLLGQGDAGKTTLANGLVGKVFAHTPSTVGIGVLTCDVKHVKVEAAEQMDVYGRILWDECEKPVREYEAALAAEMRAVQSRAKVSDPAADAFTNDGMGKESDDVSNHVKIHKSSAAPRVQTVAPARTFANPTPSVAVTPMLEPVLKQSSVSKTVAQTVQPKPASSVSRTKELPVDKNSVMKELARLQGTTTGLFISVFDFGGQSVFDVIHHLFLTRNGVYALVFNMEWLLSDDLYKQEALGFMRKWLSSITAHTLEESRTAPIVIAGTHMDTISDAAEHERISAVLQQELCDSLAWPSVIKNESNQLTFFPVDNKMGKNGASMLRLMSTVHEAMDQSEYTHKEVPLAWFKAIDVLSDTKKDCLPLTEVVATLSECNMSEEELPLLLSFLHDMGHLMWLDEPGLRDVVILDPVSYLVTPATIIICRLIPDSKDDDRIHFRELHAKCQGLHAREFNQLFLEGVLETILLPILWEEFQRHAAVLLQLMVKFGLLVPLRSVLTDGPPTQYLVPSLLPAAPKDKNVTDAWTKKSDFITFFLVVTLVEHLHSAPTLSAADLAKYGFLPAAMFERMVGDALVWSQDTAVDSCIDLNRVKLHKDLAILSFGQQRFRLMPCEHMHSVRVDVEGSNPVGIFQRLSGIIKRNASNFMGALRVFAAVVHELQAAEGTEAASPPLPSCTVKMTESQVLIPVEMLRQGAGTANGSSGKGIWKNGETVLSAEEIRNSYPQWVTVPGSRDSYDIFIPRTSTDADRKFTEQLFDTFTNYSVGAQSRAVSVFLAEKSISDGSSTLQETVRALTTSLIALPVVSLETVLTMRTFDSEEVEPELLEWILVLALVDSEKASLRKVFPILFGEQELFGSTGALQGRLAIETAAIQLPKVIPKATLECAVELLQAVHICLPEKFLSITVYSVVQKLLQFKAFSAAEVPINRLVATYAWRSVCILDEDVLVVPAAKRSTELTQTEGPNAARPATEKDNMVAILEAMLLELRADVKQLREHCEAANNMLRTLIDGTHDIPTLAVIFPEVQQGWISALNPMNLMRQKYRLFFLCTNTHKPVKCGPKGEGYEIKLTREWVIKARPVLQVGLVMLKVALLASGLPLPVPDLAKVLIDEVDKAKFLNMAFKLISDPPADNGLTELAVNLATEGNIDMSVDSIMLDKSAMQAYCTIKTLLPTDDKGFLLDTGLRKVTNSLGETGWVEDTDAAQQEWEGKGPARVTATAAAGIAMAPAPPTGAAGGGGMKVGGVWPPGAAPAEERGGGSAGHKKKGFVHGMKRMVLGPKKNKPKDK